MKQAVLDIGSNTIRLLIAETTGSQHKKIHYQHAIARLGEGLQQTGQLSEAGMARAMLIFREFSAICQSFSIETSNIKAVATAAIREASNGASFVAQVLAEIALNIQIIDGETEALLALNGARLGLGEDIANEMLLFDIGGGSTEFSRIIDSKLVDSFSLKLGVVRLKELYISSDPVTTDEYQQMKTHTQEHLKELVSFWQHKGLPKHLVGTAGTVTALAAIAQGLETYDAKRIDGYVLSRESFDVMRDDMLAQTNAQRLENPMLEKGREDVIVAGVAIVETLFEKWGFDEMITVDSGLLEGLFLYKT